MENRTIELQEKVKQLEKDVQKSKMQYSNMVNSLFMGIAIHVNNKIVFANHALINLIGGNSEEDFLGRNILEFVHPEDPGKVMEIVNAAFSKSGFAQKELPDVIEERLIKTDGSEIIVEVSAILMDYYGDTALMVMINDITDRKQADKVLRESEAKYKNLYSMMRLMSDNLPDLIWTKDTEGKYLFVNKACSKILLNARDTDEPIGKTDMYFADRIRKLHPENPDYHTFGKTRADSDLFVLTNKKPQRFDEFGNVKGEFLFFDVYKAPFYDHNGEITGTVGCARIVTKEKQMEKELGESEEKYRLLADNTLDCIWKMDKNFRFTYVNPSIFTMLGFTANEWIGSTLTEYCTEQDMQKVMNTINEFMANKMLSSIFEITLFHKNGSEIPVEITGLILINENNEIIGFQGATRDITERKQVEEQLAAQNKKLKIALEKTEESDRLKTAFLQNISHEIRTPMNGILGFTNLLRKSELTGEEQQTYIDIIKKSGDRMLNTFDDLIDISKIESGQVKVNISKINVNERIENLYAFFKPEAENKGIQLLFNSALPAREANICIDTDKLYSILTNLIKNAIKFTKEGSVEFGYNLKSADQEMVGESVSEFVEPAELEFFVKDTGIGISKDRQQTVFDRFVQSDTGLTRTYEGAGLGLSIAKAYIEILGGKIWVESEEGKGSQFYFTIPYQPDGYKEKLNIKMDINKIDLIDWSKIKILIVEDDLYSIEYLTEVLSETKAHIEIAKNGNDALKKAKENSDLDLILMDIQLPGISGDKVTTLIRKFNRDIPIIAQTAHAMLNDKEDYIKAGCTDYISKPILIDELFSVLCKYI